MQACSRLNASKMMVANHLVAVHILPGMRHCVEKALKAFQDLREAKKWREWEDAGWPLDYWQVQQVKFLETGKLWKEMIEANVAYGHGMGADIGLSKEQAATLQIYTLEIMSKYWTT